MNFSSTITTFTQFLYYEGNQAFSPHVHSYLSASAGNILEAADDGYNVSSSEIPIEEAATYSPRDIIRQ